MTHDEMIAVITAHKDGKIIQFRWKGSITPAAKWKDVVGNKPAWQFEYNDYRVKPREPRVVYALVNKLSHGVYYQDSLSRAEELLVKPVNVGCFDLVKFVEEIKEPV